MILLQLPFLTCWCHKYVANRALNALYVRKDSDKSTVLKYEKMLHFKGWHLVESHSLWCLSRTISQNHPECRWNLTRQF